MKYPSDILLLQLKISTGRQTTLTLAAPVHSLPILNHIQTVAIPRTYKPNANHTKRSINQENLIKIQTLSAHNETCTILKLGLINMRSLKGPYYENSTFLVLLHVHLGIWRVYQPKNTGKKTLVIFVMFPGSLLWSETS